MTRGSDKAEKETDFIYIYKGNFFEQKNLRSIAELVNEIGQFVKNKHNNRSYLDIRSYKRNAPEVLLLEISDEK